MRLGVEIERGLERRDFNCCLLARLMRGVRLARPAVSPVLSESHQMTDLSPGERKIKSRKFRGRPHMSVQA
jgi:hypothetical protein